MQVNYVVPLGCKCQLTYQLRRYFNFATAFPFDWWVTNMRGVIDTLEGKDPYGDLVETVMENSGLLGAPRSSDYNIEIHHEFPRGPQLSETDNTHPVLPDWRDHIGEARARFNYLYARLLSLNTESSTILFVRHKGNVAPSENLTLAGNPASIDELIGCVNSIFTRSNNQFLLINTPTSESGVALSVDDNELRSWRGEIDNWNAALPGSGFVLDNPSLKPFRHSKTWEAW